MNTPDTLSTLSSMYGRASALTDDEKLYIEHLYVELLSRPFNRRTGCSDCYRDALIELQIKIKNTGMEKQKYALKNGVVLYIHSRGEYYTNANLTNEIAAEYLAANPDEIKFFAQTPVPEDDEEVENPIEPEEGPAQTPVPEVKIKKRSRK